VAARLADDEQGLVRFQDLRLIDTLRLAVGESATPPASGAGDRWFDSSRPDLYDTKRGGGAAVLASLMSSRRGFESHPRHARRADFGGVAQRKSARLSGDRPPVRVRSSPLVVAVV
jgi:hypothetical protein